MAAATEQPAPQLVDLRQLIVSQLDELLQEEVDEWMRRLNWDFQPSAALVRRYVASGALNGYALLSGRKAVGYVYFVYESSKGLIGDLYLRKGCPNLQHEVTLLGAALDDLFHVFGVARVESQVLLMRCPGRCPLPYPEWLSLHPRRFMVRDLKTADKLPPHPSARTMLIQTWAARLQEEAAHVIARAYHGHIDSQVNDQYRSLHGARRFLTNIVQYPGCGAFFQPASFVALDALSGRMWGVCLASILSPGTGHITQICVTPEAQGRGIGYELLRRSLLALRESGCRRASLTVTAANANAVQLYERAGFITTHEFPALVWDRS